MINDEGLKSLERLHQMKTDGIITEADFEAAKAKLLSQATPNSKSSAASKSGPLPAFTGELPAQDDHIAWALLPLRRYADFTGRSTRREFWMFQLAITTALFVTLLFAVISPDLSIVLMGVVILGALLPVWAVQVRRFHDQDKSGFYALVNLIPYAGAVIALIFMTLEGTQGDNQFGPDPKA